MAENLLETGEALMINKVLLEHEKESAEPIERKALFRTMCKVKGKFCKMVIDSGSTENIVSIEMVEKLNLKKSKTSSSLQGIVVAQRPSNPSK